MPAPALQQPGGRAYLLTERLRTMIRGSPAGAAAPAQAPAPPSAAVRAEAELQSRHSHGLEQFFVSLEEREGLSILDLGPASQANISFITSLGHRISTEDFVSSLDAAFGGGDFYAHQSDPERLKAFMSESLRLKPQSQDGALLWDGLEYLSPSLIQAVVERLFFVMKPQSYLLAFFHADERATTIPAYSYRIANRSTLLLAPRGQRQPYQFFNNRSLEKLFARFQSVKFFLTRDHLREVLVRR